MRVLGPVDLGKGVLVIPPTELFADDDDDMQQRQRSVFESTERLGAAHLSVSVYSGVSEDAVAGEGALGNQEQLGFRAGAGGQRAAWYPAPLDTSLEWVAAVGGYGALIIEHVLGGRQTTWYADLRSGTYAIPPSDQVRVHVCHWNLLAQAPHGITVQAAMRETDAPAPCPWRCSMSGLIGVVNGDGFRRHVLDAWVPPLAREWSVWCEETFLLGRPPGDVTAPVALILPNQGGGGGLAWRDTAYYSGSRFMSLFPSKGRVSAWLWTANHAGQDTFALPAVEFDIRP